MREPGHAASIVAAMASAVSIPVTVKMRAGWDDRAINASALARMVEDAGAAAVAVHGRTAAQAYAGHSDWNLIGEVAASVGIPVLGSGDCVEADQINERLATSRISGVLVGRGVLRNPWILAQARDVAEGRAPRTVSAADRGRFLLEYIELLLSERVDEADGFRHSAVCQSTGDETRTARGRQRWVINKLRALAAWYTKGFEHGSQLRVAVNGCESLAGLRETIAAFFFEGEIPRPANGAFASLVP
jgi:tRNA-dihydrouridine synthase